MPSGAGNLKNTHWLGPSNRNATEIAKIAEDAGIQALAIMDAPARRFVGEVEHDSIAQVVEKISIPVIANGDINSPQQAAEVLSKTDANAVMIGRGAQGNPWIFNQINHYLEQGELLPQQSRRSASNDSKFYRFAQLIWRGGRGAYLTKTYGLV